MKVLMIEDDKDILAGIEDYCDDKGYEHKCIDFPDDSATIENYDPDIIVLDLKDSCGKFSGAELLSIVWERFFRPVCVFSGELTDAVLAQKDFVSPIVCFKEKGDISPVIEFIEKVAPYATSIKDMQKKTHDAMRKSFDVLEYVMQDGIEDVNLIAFLCHNRIKEYFTEENCNIQYPMWSQYIYPVLSQQFTTGDLICEKSLSTVGKASRYKVILSQACDIQNKKIDSVLVASCQSINSLLNKTIKNEETGEYDKEIVKAEVFCSIANTGYEHNLFPLPELKNVIPDLVIDLKKLSFIKLDELQEKYRKVISLSSPYKERLIWAYMQNACRPGVPTLNVEKWANRIITAISEDKK